MFLFVVSFAFAGNDSLTNSEVKLTDVTFTLENNSQNEQATYAMMNLITIEIDNTVEDYPCRWRYCITVEGDKYCTEWNYGECLEEVMIE